MLVFSFRVPVDFGLSDLSTVVCVFSLCCKKPVLLQLEWRSCDSTGTCVRHSFMTLHWIGMWRETPEGAGLGSIPVRLPLWSWIILLDLHGLYLITNKWVWLSFAVLTVYSFALSVFISSSSQHDPLCFTDDILSRFLSETILGDPLISSVIDFSLIGWLFGDKNG